MVILSAPYGGLSNRLFQHIHLNSFCLDSGVEFANPFVTCGPKLADAQRAFGALRAKDRLIALGKATQLRFDRDGADYSAHERIMREEEFVFVEGWHYRNERLTALHRDMYRASVYDAAPSPLRTTIDESTTNIAVHVRRGDYRFWQEGRYFFPDTVYLNAVDQVAALVPDDYRILVFSDDHGLDREAYRSRYRSVSFSDRDAQSDHYLMSRCDYIVGPPSTFSMWASYIGKAKYCHIRSGADAITADSFTICDR